MHAAGEGTDPFASTPAALDSTATAARPKIEGGTMSFSTHLHPSPADTAGMTVNNTPRDLKSAGGAAPARVPPTASTPTKSPLAEGGAMSKKVGAAAATTVMGGGPGRLAVLTASPGAKIETQTEKQSAVQNRYTPAPSGPEKAKDA